MKRVWLILSVIDFIVSIGMFTAWFVTENCESSKAAYFCISMYALASGFRNLIEYRSS